PSPANANVASASNYDILKRISRLEKEVFGKQIVE
ncbi:MAG: cell division regulator GpsB, partial [Streptococcus sp.]|nr:cell division regulator GpsB [Streptococcus sp.]